MSINIHKYRKDRIKMSIADLFLVRKNMIKCARCMRSMRKQMVA